MASLGVGVVGCGGNGLRHASLYNSMDEVELLGVCDVDQATAERVAAKFGVKSFTRVEDLVAEDGLDAVSIVTSGSHGDPTVAALDAGKHALVEVAFANSLEDCDRMISAAERSGANLMYAQTHRFFPQSVKMKELIDGGAIGEPISVTQTTVGPGEPDSSQWHRWRATGGGYFMYEGPHFFDQLKWLMGSEIDTVYTVGMGRHASGGDGEDNGIAGLQFKSGAFGVMVKASSASGAGYSSLRVIGTEASVERVENEVRLGKNEWTSVPYPHKHDPPVQGLERISDPTHYHAFLDEFTEFLSSIREGRQPSVTGHDGRASIEAALAVRRSHETGAPVRLPL